MPCKTIDEQYQEAVFSVEIDDTGLPAVEYVEQPAADRKKRKKARTGHMGLTYDTVADEATGEKGCLTLLFESAEKKAADSLPKERKPFETESDEQSHEETADSESCGKADQQVTAADEYARSNDLYSYSDNRRSYQSFGIIYDVAEELYRRERTRMEVEALCKPPFHKVFDGETIDILEQQADERTKRLLADYITESKKKADASGASRKPLTTAKALGLQLLFILPIVNVFFALLFSFSPRTDKSIRSFARAYMILSSVFLMAALVYFMFSYFNNPNGDSFFIRLMSLF